MKIILRYIQQHPLHILFLAFPFAILAKMLGWGPGWVFGLSAAAVIPLAGLIGAVHLAPAWMF